MGWSEFCLLTWALNDLYKAIMFDCTVPRYTSLLIEKEALLRTKFNWEWSVGD